MKKYIVHFNGAAKDSKGICEVHTACVECENHTKIPEALAALGYTKTSTYRWQVLDSQTVPLT